MSEAAHARNEMLKSYVNDRVDDINDGLSAETEISDWICECSDVACTAPVTASAADYDRIRAHPRRFLVRPGHHEPRIERIVEEHSHYLVVEKTGRAGEIADRTRAEEAG